MFVNSFRFHIALGVIACCALLAPALSVAAVQNDGMPTQAQTDMSSSDPSNSSGTGWGDMANGVVARPYVQALSIINGTTTTPVIENGQPGSSGSGAGGVGAVISPFNLCRPGQVPSEGTCYATPNRIGITMIYAKGNNAGWDFSNTPGNSVAPTVTANSIIDMTVALNSLGTSLRWSWVNGDLLYWQPTNLGQPNASIRIKFRPVVTPWISSYPAGNGCSATPIFNCNIPAAEAEGLGANLVLSLDQTLDVALTGAVFATQSAIIGFLQPGGTAQAPVVDIQVVSSHLTSTGAIQTGNLRAFLPAAALMNLYGLLPADAGATFTASRSGSAGTNGAPTFTPWAAAVNGAEGLLVNVTDITFSSPTYRVRSTLKRVVATAVAAKGRTRVTARVAACSRPKPCKATLYSLGPKALRYTATRTAVLKNAPVWSAQLALSVGTAKLRKGHRYLLVVRRGSKLVTSTTGSVR